MIPVSLDPHTLRVALAGHGPAALRRWQLLLAGGAEHALCFCDEADDALTEAAGPRLRHGLPDDTSLATLDVLWVVGVPDEAAAALAVRARAQKVLVNVEDRREHCSFHNSAELRRGALLLTVSTGGRSPGLAQSIRGQLAREFGPEWGERLEAIGRKRDVWRQEGHSLPALAAMTRDLVKQNGWLDMPATNEE
jgi:precorrin-2 dehydrogenase / sirohydrochlorin ferrochelatase